MEADEMAGWHHQFNGHELEQTPGDGEGQGSLAYYSPWDHKELDTTEQQSRGLNICLVWKGGAWRATVHGVTKSQT